VPWITAALPVAVDLRAPSVSTPAPCAAPRRAGRRHPAGGKVAVLLRLLVALGSDEVPPHVGEHDILRHAVPLSAHETEGGLRIGVALFGGEPKPARRLDIVRHSAAKEATLPAVTNS
jgi:hypothetical protein